MHAVWALQEAGYKALIVNSNPETVSTDFDTSDRLYFEPLDEESMREILHNEEIDDVGPGTIVQFGGQTAINLASPRTARRATSSAPATKRSTWPRTAGASRTSSASIGIPQPPGAGIRTIEEALSDGAGDRLPGAGAALLRARRPRDGDRPERDGAAALLRRWPWSCPRASPS